MAKTINKRVCAEMDGGFVIFLIGMRLLAGAIDGTRAGKAFSDLADLTIGAALDAVAAEFAVKHGRVAGGRVCVLGMGKLGSRELTAGSDVDLCLLSLAAVAPAAGLLSSKRACWRLPFSGGTL